MSADNWAVCPKCGDNLRKELKKKEEEVKESYGTVSRNRYEHLQYEYSELAAKELNQTLREDFEIGIDMDGLFEVSYEAYCSECRFNFKYEHKAQIVEITPEEDDA